MAETERELATDPKHGRPPPPRKPRTGIGVNDEPPPPPRRPRRKRRPRRRSKSQASYQELEA